MSNVKTGDIAYIAVVNDPDFVESLGKTCLVGARATGWFSVQCNHGLVYRCELDSAYLHWWCKFSHPYLIALSRTGGLRFETTAEVPIADSHLRKICDGNFTFPASELDLALPKPIDAEERARVATERNKRGTVIPK